MTRDEFNRQLVRILPYVRRLALRFCNGNMQNADDLAQEVLVAALVGIEEFREESSLETWITGIALYKGARVWRNRRLYIDLDEIADMPSTYRGQDLLLEDKDLRARLNKAMLKLSAREMTVFALFYFEHKKIREIADIQGVGISTVTTELTNARNKLKKELSYEDIQ